MGPPTEAEGPIISSDLHHHVTVVVQRAGMMIELDRTSS
ncbi:MAG: hypothetical protein RL347_1175 [Actinomycetota bacterium]|jgi:hypothetical protein